jgi:hypothetical protein
VCLCWGGEGGHRTFSNGRCANFVWLLRCSLVEQWKPHTSHGNVDAECNCKWPLRYPLAACLRAVLLQLQCGHCTVVGGLRSRVVGAVAVPLDPAAAALSSFGETALASAA